MNITPEQVDLIVQRVIQQLGTPTAAIAPKINVVGITQKDFDTSIV